jgi:hypothetical protein
MAYSLEEIREDVRALKADLPRGELAYAQVTSVQGSITSEADLTGLSVTVSVGEGRRIKITGSCIARSTATGDRVDFRIKEGTTELKPDTRELGTANDAGRSGLHAEVVLSPSAGSHTYKLTLARGDGTGTVSMVAAATAPAFILVEDIGPA